jgi:uncharacterized membrane protein
MKIDTSKSRGYANVRTTFLAGIFAVIPVAVTAFILWWVDNKTVDLTQVLFGIKIHFLGVLIALAAIYAVGIVTNSLLGKYFLKLIDAIIMRLPGIRLLYQGWKQIALTPGGTESTFSNVVLIPDETGTMRLLGFCSGRIVEADEPSYCVFIPSSPNPITGRLYFIRASRCQFIQMSTEEAFKIILSTGNYVPPLIPIAAPEAAQAV